MTRANALTAVRLACAPVIAAAIWSGADGLALAAFLLAITSDWFDGPVARRYGEASPVGGFFDHATDAIFVTSGLTAVALNGEGTLWLPPLIVAAFFQYTLDSGTPRGRPLRASALGRWNGIAYFVLLGIPVVRDGLSLGWPPPAWTTVGAWLLVAATIASAADRMSSRYSTS